MKEKEEDLSTLSRRIILMEEEVGDRGRQRGYRRQGQTEREGIGVDREVGDRSRQRSRRQEQKERQEIGVDREEGDRGRQRGRRQGQTEKQEIEVDREVEDRGRQRGRRQGQTERQEIGVDREVIGDRGRQRERGQGQTERQEIGVDREVGDRGRQRGRRQGQTERLEIGVDREVGDRGRQRGMGETVYFLFCFPPGNKKKYLHLQISVPRNVAFDFNLSGLTLNFPASYNSNQRQSRQISTHLFYLNTHWNSNLNCHIDFVWKIFKRVKKVIFHFFENKFSQSQKLECFMFVSSSELTAFILIKMLPSRLLIYLSNKRFTKTFSALS